MGETIRTVREGNRTGGVDRKSRGVEEGVVSGVDEVAVAEDLAAEICIERFQEGGPIVRTVELVPPPGDACPGGWILGRLGEEVTEVVEAARRGIVVIIAGKERWEAEGGVDEAAGTRRQGSGRRCDAEASPDLRCGFGCR
ncbi:hypothetical protein HPP92_012506 [Vanilla planifolia]|uniref:Uncharacterized protein n=1 Tax=Vanilla planifolia TaxID=51239 RepID=A0A835UXL4_VANPL|nr:hypothetical protein HPP92_012506 [Vanilla planifolia]